MGIIELDRKLAAWFYRKQPVPPENKVTTYIDEDGRSWVVIPDHVWEKAEAIEWY